MLFASTTSDFLDWLNKNMPALLAAMAAAWAAWQGMKNKTAIQEVHFALNSRLTEYLETTRQAEHAKGVIQGTQAAQAAQVDPKVVAETAATATLAVAKDAAEATIKAADEAAIAKVAAAERIK